MPQASQSTVVILSGPCGSASFSLTPRAALVRCLRTSGPGWPSRWCHILESPLRGLRRVHDVYLRVRRGAGEWSARSARGAGEPCRFPRLCSRTCCPWISSISPRWLPSALRRQLLPGRVSHQNPRFLSCEKDTRFDVRAVQRATPNSLSFLGDPSADSRVIVASPYPSIRTGSVPDHRKSPTGAAVRLLIREVSLKTCIDAPESRRTLSCSE
jgi:hypothetical protein